MSHPAIRTVEAYCFRYPLATPVITSFGRMTDRPALFVRIEDEDGVAGWGEVWCNFPSFGAEHRARIVTDLLAPAIVGHRPGERGHLFQRLSAGLSVLALQSGEPGPTAQAIAGIDIAHWDLAARRAGLPVWRLLGGQSPTIPVYASGINPVGSGDTARRALKAGHRAFKLKVGFGVERDRDNLRAVRREIGDLFLAADANQAWAPDEALAVLPAMREFDLGWLEEPIRADLPWNAWRPLVEAGAPRLAGGENLASEAAFGAALDAGVLDVIQPDVAKWGGITLCAKVARDAVAAGRCYCPHFLGGGIGLLASAHLLAGVGGAGMLEVDVNPNALRDGCCGPVAAVVDGQIRLSEEPGLGAEPDLAAWSQWRTR